jgi:hypothetical protein
MRRLALFLAPTVLLAGCKAVEPAPKELDALLRFFFSDYEDAEDETMAEAFRNLDKAVDGGSVEHSDGTVTRLTDDEISSTGLSHADPSKAVGLYMVNPVECSFDKVVELVTAKNQGELYEGTYESFSRDWTSDVAGFRSGSEDIATWDEEFSVSKLGINYSAENIGGARMIPEIDEEQSPYGRNLVTRRYMDGPADMEDDDRSYPQDWRVEVYYERSNGNLVHASAMWREADFGFTNSESEGTQRLLLNGLKDWDNTTEDHCAD